MENGNEDKRNLILNDKGKNKKYIIPAAVLIILIAVSCYYFYSRPEMKTEVISANTGSEPEGVSAKGAPVIKKDEVVYSVPDFNDGKARFFSYNNSGTTIKYFILKSSDGKLRAAFDACDVCWRAGRGYSQDGDYMVCNNCGRNFISNMINVVSGGCNPSPLTITVSGNEASVKISDIAKGDVYFKGVE